MFLNRADAGAKLAKQLIAYEERPDVIVVGLPRGGVVVGRSVADELGLPLSFVISKKIPAPGEAEYAIGALSEEGEPLCAPGAEERYGKEAIAEVARVAREEQLRRLETYGAWHARPSLRDKIVIVVDDGMATGYTMHAALRSIRLHDPQKIIVAVPVMPKSLGESFQIAADELVALMVPSDFSAVGTYYHDFAQVTDEEVRRSLEDESP